MAAEGGGFKPGDFFIGVVELFAIFLPGAILTYIVWGLDLQCLITQNPCLFPKLTPPAGAAGLTFAVISYVVGHLLAAIGWVSMDTVFEAQHNKNRFGRLTALEKRAKAVVPEWAKLTEEADLFPWALAYIDTQYPAAAGKLEAIEADCKFCRNLIPTLFLTLPILDVARFHWFSGTNYGDHLDCLFLRLCFGSESFISAGRVCAARREPEGPSSPDLLRNHASAFVVRASRYPCVHKYCSGLAPMRTPRPLPPLDRRWNIRGRSADDSTIHSPSIEKNDDGLPLPAGGAVGTEERLTAEGHLRHFTDPSIRSKPKIADRVPPASGGSSLSE